MEIDRWTATANEHSGFKWGSGFRVYVLVQLPSLNNQGLGFRVEGLGFRV